MTTNKDSAETYKDMELLNKDIGKSKGERYQTEQETFVRTPDAGGVSSSSNRDYTQVSLQSQILDENRQNDQSESADDHEPETGYSAPSHSIDRSEGVCENVSWDETDSKVFKITEVAGLRVLKVGTASEYLPDSLNITSDKDLIMQDNQLLLLASDKKRYLVDVKDGKIGLHPAERTEAAKINKAATMQTECTVTESQIQPNGSLEAKAPESYTNNDAVPKFSLRHDFSLDGTVVEQQMTVEIGEKVTEIDDEMNSKSCYNGQGVSEKSPPLGNGEEQSGKSKAEMSVASISNVEVTDVAKAAVKETVNVLKDKKNTDQEFEIPLALASILHDENTRQELDHKFPHIVYTCSYERHRYFCKVEGLNKKECCDAREYILNLANKYGTVVIGFKDIKNLKKLKNSTHILEALLRSLSEKISDMKYEIDMKKDKIIIFTEDQKLADVTADKIKKGIAVKEEIIPRELDVKKYIALSRKAVSEYGFSNEVEVESDEECFKVKFMGLKESVDSVTEKLKPVSTTCEINRADKFDMIIDNCKEEADGKVEIVPSKHKLKQEIIFRGPALYVEEIMQYVEKLEQSIKNESVSSSLKGQFELKETNAGQEVLGTVRQGSSVQLTESLIDEGITEGVDEAEWILPNGQKIILTTKQFGCMSAELKVHLEDVGAEGLTGLLKSGSETIFCLGIPVKDHGKNKHRFHNAVEHMLKIISDRNFRQMAVLLREVGGWNFTAVVKNLLYPVKEHLKTSKRMSLSWTFCVHDRMLYSKALHIMEHFLSATEGDRKGAQKSSLQVSVVAGSLCDQQVDVLVNTAKSNLDLKDGVLSASLLARAGPEIQDECNQYKRGHKPVEPWSIIQTGNYKLPCKFVLHGVLGKWKRYEDIKTLQDFLYRCLVKSNELQMNSVAFPALGTGKLGYPARDVASAIFEAARYYQMKVKCSSLNQVYIVIYPEDTANLKEFRDVEKFQKDAETQRVTVDDVYLQARSTDMKTVKADTLIFLWERTSFNSAKSTKPPFSTFGRAAFEDYTVGRKQKGFHTFCTVGGDLNVPDIIHACIPYYDTSEKLTSALQEAFTFVVNKESEVIVIFFNTSHPMLKYASLIPRCLIDTMRAVAVTKPSLKSVSLIVEGIEDFQNLQRQFDHCIEELQLEGDKQIASRMKSSNVVTLHVQEDLMVKSKTRTEKIDSAQESRMKMEDKQAEILNSEQNNSDRHTDSCEETHIEPPTKQEISREIRGCHDPTFKEGEDQAETDARYTTMTVAEGANTDIQKSAERKTLQDSIMEMKVPDAKTEGQTNEGTEWDSALLIPDSEELLCVEMAIPDVRDDENYCSLKQNICEATFPVATPSLIYPFENRSKALLVCKNKEDASRLSDFKTERFIYKRLKAPCLQMPKLTLSAEYCDSLKNKGLFDRCKSRLEEMGCVEERRLQDKMYLSIAVYSLAQIDIISGFLQSLEDHSASSSMGNASFVSNKGFHDIHKVRDVSQIAWTAVNISLSKELAKLTTQNINISYQEGTILIDGCTNEEDIANFKDTVKKLKDQQMEEIKPTKSSEPFKVYQKWCSEIESTLGTSCCVFDQKKAVFIAFGKTYEDMCKVKHQLGLKQGTIKQTGRRGRNFDTPAKSADTGLSEDISVHKKRTKDFNWSVDAREVRRYKTCEGIDVFVYIANILKLPVDCIVNAANDTLQHGGGVAYVIEKGAGWALKQESEDLVRDKGNIPVGMACTTTAGDLPYECVIHAVGPRWYDFHPYAFADVQDCERKLKAAIINSFLQAEKKGLETIALPAISAAIFAVPEKMCAVQYAKAVIQYSRNSTAAHDTLKEIHFIDKNPIIVRLIQEIFQIMITEKRETDYNVYDYVKIGPSTTYQKPQMEQNREYTYKWPSRSFDTGGHNLLCIESGKILEVHSENPKHQVLLYSGDILKVQTVGVVVCNDDEYGNGKGGIAKALLDMTRHSSYATKKRQEFRNRKKLGDVVVTTGEGTYFKYVFHAILSGMDRKRSEYSDLVKSTYKNILATTIRKGINSLVCPLLGTGAHTVLSHEESASAFLTSFQEFGKQDPGKDKNLTIHLVCLTNSEKDRVAAVFKRFCPEEYTGREDKTNKFSEAVTDVERHGRTDMDESCVICQDTLTDPKTLPCLHTFCKGCIDNYLDNYKKVCPTCGKVCGIITGDQPAGTMTVNVDSSYHCSGFEDCGRIEIIYHFPGGKQKPGHPNPGTYYRGITRTAYLPDNRDGNEILDLLRIAFKRNLIFTIGSSRTTGKDDVITWNDIHHKTNPNPYQNFGYPDAGYFARVKDELAVKGVTVNDITHPSAKMSMRGDKTLIC